jgi:hypothetical protein
MPGEVHLRHAAAADTTQDLKFVANDIVEPLLLVCLRHRDFGYLPDLIAGSLSRRRAIEQTRAKLVQISTAFVCQSNDAKSLSYSEMSSNFPVSAGLDLKPGAG